ncbi:MAG: cell wall metabolism sensor histidine kinase WalK [Firmicutes bacterium]|nr:cell wall metabolism sensor histidine kinase WalK [Bacillota bacterium]
MARFYSIRFRLTAYFLIIILAVMIIISIFLYSTLERYHMNNFTNTLERSAYLASDFVAGQLRGQVDSVRLSALAENMSRQSQARVIFTDSQGVVVGDSLRVGGMLNQILDQDDLRKALVGEVSFSIVYSETVGHDVMQMAVPVEDADGNLTGTVFLSVSLEEVYRTLFDIRRFLFLATLLAMAIVGGGSIILARRFTGPLEELTLVVKKMAEGKLEQQIVVSSGDEIGRLAEQFNVMARKLNFYTSNLKKFAADVAHEVRTPLTTMSLLTKALKEHEMKPAQRKEFTADLDGELERLIALVNDLLELSKLEKNNIEHQEINLNEFLREVIGENQFRFAQAGLELLENLPAEDLIICGAPMQLRQVIGNLLDNAHNYTPMGGTITVALERIENEAVTSVVDTGCGIPHEDLSFIFERFFRVDRARSREGGGTGLGLAIVSEIISKHGGRVWVESEEGLGSRFIFALPVISETDVTES